MLDVFELRVLARPIPTTDLTAIHTELDSVRADVDVIL